MKKLFLTLIFGFALFNLQAQTWQTDLTKAEKLAKDENKEILLVFQGSDWCAPCIKLDREVWSTDEFKNYAEDHFVLLKADFPKRSKNALSPEQQEKNNQLAETYNQNGYFPFVVLLNEEGKVLGETGYKSMSPQQYIKLLNSFKG
ncbi:MAG: thioredoxin family protein [Christiangramia sp.]